MLTPQEFRELFVRETGLPVQEQAGLDRFSSFRIGGPADLLYEPRTEGDLKQAVALAVRERFPFYVIGGGYNILFDDEGYRGLIIRNRADGVGGTDGRLSVLSGTGLQPLLQEALARGLGGLEFLAGIPGTLGGALFSNAGAFGRSLGDFVEEAFLLEAGGGERRLSREDFGFGYRRSSLQRDHGIVLRAVLKAEPGDRKASEARIKEYMEKRRAKHPPWGTACAGSFFKNPCLPEGEKVAAGRLLEQAGARGMKAGGAAVFEGHCNFIINAGNAKARDVLVLARELKERVFETSGVRLEEEVVYLPATASML
jgi:UDP-N-acetylmuramate dehydrogenase